MPFPLATTDRLMLRFSRTGDPRVLGRLFDRTAPELLRIATWLCGNRTDAEDLLQRTFVTVIEARGNYDPARRALPWLCGIVGNHAKKLHEQRQRSFDLGDGPPAERDPSAVAADAELAATVTQLRAEMGSPYAEVLDLHLGQGLNSKQIAERLDRPAGTVRTQLVRALALLRKRLPSGFVAGMLVAPAVQAASLATVRAMVIGKASVGTAAVAGSMAATATSSIGGMLVAKKLAVVVPVLLLLLGGGAWALWQTKAADDQVPKTTQAVGAEIEGRRKQPLANELVAEPTQREAVRPLSGEAVDPGFATLVVRIKWQHDGSPAPAVGVRVLPQPGSRFLNHDGLTDFGGTVRLHGIRPGPCWVTSTFTKLHQLDLDAGVVQTIELTAQRAGVVHGTVVDADGRAVADARLWLSDRSNWSDGFEVGRSDEAGRFELPIGSSHYLGACKAGHTPSYLRDIEAKGTPEVTLRLRGPGGAARGKVFGANGQPLAGAIVEIGMPGGWTIPGSTRHERLVHPTPPRVRTSTSGEFHFEGVEPRSNVLHAWASGHAPFEGAVLVEAGKTSETIVAMQRGAIVEGTVRDAHQKPIPKVHVVANVDQISAVGVQTDEQGHFRLDDLPSGTNRLQAKLEGEAAHVDLQLTAGATTSWNPVLSSGTSRSGTIVDARGKALSGFDVGMLENNHPIPRRWATSGTDGRFVLTDVGEAPLDLFVQLGDTPVAQRPGVPADAADLVITLTDEEMPTASIQGRVVDQTGRPIAASMTVMNRAFRYGHGASNDPADGTFRCGPLPAGVFAISIEARGFGRVPLDSVKLLPGETRTLGDTVLAPVGRAEIKVFADSDFRGGMVGIWRDDGTSMTHLMMEGKQASGDLPPGSYIAVVQTGHREAGSVAFVVRSGEVTACELRCAASAVLTIDFREPSRSDPALTVSTLVRNASHELVQVVRTHPQNTPPLRTTARLAPGTYDLDSTSSDGRRATKQVTILSAIENPALTIDLPAK